MLTTCPASWSASAMPRLWRPVASRQAWTCRTSSLASQAISWRQPSGELAKLLDRGFAPARKLVSSVVLETSMPKTASVILRVFQVLLVGSLQQPLRIDRPCTQDLRRSASQDTVRPEQRSVEKRGPIYRTGSVTEGTQQAHRFPRRPADMISRRTPRNVQGTGVTSCPPRRSRRAAFPHRAPVEGQTRPAFGAWAAHPVPVRGLRPSGTCGFRHCVRGMRWPLPFLRPFPPRSPPPACRPVLFEASSVLYGLVIPSAPASAPHLSEPARDRRGDGGRHEVSQVPTRSLRA